MSESPLVSIIILSYQNFSKIFRALESVLIQSYSNIELIITDDGSDFFSPKRITEYIDDYVEDHKTNNIKDIKILRSSQNRGTVKNLNHALENMSGELYLFFGADDALYDRFVIDSLVGEFELQDFKPLQVTGQMVMCSEDLNREWSEYVTKEYQEVHERANPKEYLEILSHTTFIAQAASMQSSGYLEVLGGKYDENYFLLEDRPSFIKMAKKAILPTFINLNVIKHGYGGIANGNLMYGESTLKEYFDDEEYLYTNEIEPLAKTFSKANAKKYNKRKKRLNQRKIMELEFWPKNIFGKLSVAFKNPIIFLWVLKSKLITLINFLYKKEAKKLLFFGLTLLFFYSMFSGVFPLPTILGPIITTVCLLLGYTLVLGSILVLIVKLLLSTKNVLGKYIK